MRMYYGDVGEGMVEKVITEVETHGECRDFTWHDAMAEKRKASQGKIKIIKLPWIL